MRPVVKPLGTTFLIVLIFSSFIANAQPEGIRFEKKSSWIKPITFDSNAKPEIGQSSSYYYLLSDEQENTVTREDYYHYVYTILTSEGIQEMSDLQFDFDPTFQ